MKSVCRTWARSGCWKKDVGGDSHRDSPSKTLKMDVVRYVFIVFIFPIVFKSPMSFLSHSETPSCEY